MQYLGFLCPFFFLVLGLIVSGLLAYFAVRTRRRAAVVEETPFTKVDRLGRDEEPVCKVRGRVVAHEELIRSPLSRRDCVYYHFLVEEMHTSTSRVGKGHSTHNYWVDVVNDKQSVAVSVEDDTGSVGVSLDEAEVVLKSTEALESGTFRDPPERLRRLLRDVYGRSTKGLLFNKQMRYSETVLVDGANVIVVGQAAEGRRGMVLRKGKEVGLIVSDKSHKQLTGHYRTKAIWYWVGAGASLTLSLVFVVCSGSLAFRWHDAVETSPPPQAIAPAAQPAAPAPLIGPPVAPAAGGVPQPPPALREEGEPPLPKVLTQRGPMGLENLTQALTWLHGDPFQQMVAAESLAKVKVYAPRQQEVARRLADLLNGGDPLVAQASMSALEVWAMKDQSVAFLKALDSAELSIREKAMDTMVRLKMPGAAEGAAKMLTENLTREKATRALIATGQSAEPDVRRYLRHEHQAVREAATRVLREIGKLSDDDRFIAAFYGLKDRSGLGRAKALEWFASAKANHPGREEAAHEMARLLENGDNSDKDGAAEALVAWATPAEVPELLRCFHRQPLGGHRTYLIQAMGQVKDKRAVPVLVEQLGVPFDEEEVEKALTGFGRSIEGDVAKALDKKGFRERLAACRVLAQIGTARSLPALNAALDKAMSEQRTGQPLAKAARDAIAAIQSR